MAKIERWHTSGVNHTHIYLHVSHVLIVEKSLNIHDDDITCFTCNKLVALYISNVDIQNPLEKGFDPYSQGY